MADTSWVDAVEARICYGFLGRGVNPSTVSGNIIVESLVLFATMGPVYGPEDRKGEGKACQKVSSAL